MIYVFIVNLIVGILVGMSGIAGFLLPIFYISIMKLNITESLSLSFMAFIVSGILGSINYYRSKLLNLNVAIIISIGSFFASIIGVKVNLLIPEQIMQVILYLVVLFSGLSILLRKDKVKDKDANYNKIGLVIIGFITGFICSVSGAGGPIIVLPILLMMNIEVHEAVAVSLFNSIFIGIPAAVGYFLNSQRNVVLEIIPFALVAHGIGVYIGSKNGSRINQKILKNAIAIFSICIAIYKIIGVII